MKRTRQLALGPEEARLLTELERQNIAVLNLGRHHDALAGFAALQIRKLIHQLAAKGWLLRIEAGKYVVVPRAARGAWHENPLVIASAIAPDAHYLSYWSALAFHDLTEQLPRVAYVALREQRKRPILFQGWRYQFVRRTTDAFYGYQQQEFRALNGAVLAEVPIAEPEKALLDSLDDELLAGGIAEIVKAVQRGVATGRFDPTRLISYASRYPNASAVARLGYIFERCGMREVSALREVVRRHGEPPLLSTKSRRALENSPVDPGWYLRVNVTDALFEQAMVP